MGKKIVQWAWKSRAAVVQQTLNSWWYTLLFLTASTSCLKGKPYYFDRVFQSKTTQEEFYNAVAQKIVKGKLCIGICSWNTKPNPNPKCLTSSYRCFGGIQRDHLCLWADIFRQNTHNGGTMKYQLLLFSNILKIARKILRFCAVLLLSSCPEGEASWPWNDGNHSSNCARHL